LIVTAELFDVSVASPPLSINATWIGLLDDTVPAPP
jgi:hypothetical protein